MMIQGIPKSHTRGHMIRTVLTIAAVVILGAPLTGRAQPGERGMTVSPATVEPITNNVYNGLFRGMSLNTAQQARAKSVIRECVVALGRINTATAAGRDSIIALLVRRDSTLKTVLTNSSDQAVFEARAVALRPRPE